jgi:hypothetical protein
VRASTWVYRLSVSLFFYFKLRKQQSVEQKNESNRFELKKCRVRTANRCHFGAVSADRAKIMTTAEAMAVVEMTAKATSVVETTLEEELEDLAAVSNEFKLCCSNCHF